jgi:hypothetical protein
MKALLRSDAFGPMGAACKEIRVAGDRFAAQRAATLGRASLLRRSDAILTALEEMNLRRVKLVPESRLAQLAALMADLPSGHRWPIASRLSPPLAMDMVFDIQQGLLRSMRGVQSEDDDFLEMAS